MHIMWQIFRNKENDISRKANGTNLISQYVFRPISIGIFAFALIIACLVTASTANAVVPEPLPSETYGPTQTAYSYVFYNALHMCISGQVWRESISDADAKSGKWFEGGQTDNPTIGFFLKGIGSGIQTATGRGYLLVGCDGDVTDWIPYAAKTIWGYDSQLKLLCDLGYQRTKDRAGNPEDCLTGTGQFEHPDSIAINNKIPLGTDKFETSIRTKIGSLPSTLADDAAKYVLNKNSFFEGCLVSEAGKMPYVDTPKDPNDKHWYQNVKIVDSITGEPVSTSFFGDQPSNYSIKYYVANDANQSNKCGDIMETINNTADAYSSAVKGGREVIPTPLVDPTADKSVTSCAIDGVGWIVCPVVRFLAMIMDESYGYLANNFLTVKPELFNTTSATYTAWSIMRNFANVAFVIAFLIIIFSQLTGFGITNYGIKKLLPRIVIAAILVNVSYYICQIAVDLSNIFGQSLSDLFNGIDIGSDGGATGFWAGGDGGFATIAGSVLVLAGAAYLMYAALATLIPILILGIFAVIMVLFILMARQAIIVLLVVISPLAFVAFLLPNTEKLFDKWRKMFVALLMLYPIVALVYSISGLASKVLNSTTKDTDIIWQILVGAIGILPLFIIPSLLKKSLDSVGNIGASLNNLGKKAGAGAGKKIMGSDMSKHLQAKRADSIARQKTGTYKGWGGSFNPGNLRSRTNRWQNKNAFFNKVSGGFGAARTLAGQQQGKKDQQEAMSLFRNDDDLAKAWANDGGEQGNEYNKLSNLQKEQYNLLRASGQHKKATSHLAAVQQLSESGKGTTAEINRALGAALANGAQAGDITSAKGLAAAAYRKNGRASMVGDLNYQLIKEYDADVDAWNTTHAAAIGAGTATRRERKGAYNASGLLDRSFYIKDEARKMNPANVHREELSDVMLPGGGSTPSEGKRAYMDNLAASRDYTRNAIASHNSMEGRSKDRADPLIWQAAEQHRLAAITAGRLLTATAPVRAAGIEATNAGIITSMEQARAYFKFTNT